MKRMCGLLIVYHGEMHSIQLHMIKFVSNLRQVSGFPPGTLFSSTYKTKVVSFIHANCEVY
jgi:hypothetical protein